MPQQLITLLDRANWQANSLTEFGKKKNLVRIVVEFTYKQYILSTLSRNDAAMFDLVVLNVINELESN